MSTLLATRFKNRRLELKLSQVEVAEGICKQGQLSLIEKGNYSPGAELLNQLAKKLRVPMDYFFDESVEEEIESLEKFKEIAQSFLSQRDYEKLKYVYDLEISKKQKLTIREQHYLELVEAVIIYNIEKDSAKAIAKLEGLSQEISEEDKLYLKVNFDLLNMYSESNMKEEYEKLYEEISSRLSKIKILSVEDVEALIKFKYNYCHHLWENKQVEETIVEITDILELSKKYNSRYLLGDLYFLLGTVSQDFLSEEKVKEYYEAAHTLYKLDDNKNMILVLEKYLKDNYEKRN
ncbi:MAG: helix-turn-helix domain-containing protein [Gemella sp.]|nr:helix-turn-helix domain-containing protein [Gemella sp.]